jgi:DNA-directed RNA polymerase specialized sigma24 family protein
VLGENEVVSERIEVSEYLASPNLKKRLNYLCKKYGKGDEVDDVFQEYCLYILDGKSNHQTLEQFFIDYSRRHHWTKNLRFQEVYENTEAQEEKEEVEKIEFEKILTGTKRAIFVMHSILELETKDIALAFDVSTSRVHQVLREIKKEIRAYGNKKLY